MRVLSPERRMWKGQPRSACPPATLAARSAYNPSATPVPATGVARCRYPNRNNAGPGCGRATGLAERPLGVPRAQGASMRVLSPERRMWGGPAARLNSRPHLRGSQAEKRSGGPERARSRARRDQARDNRPKASPQPHESGLYYRYILNYFNWYLEMKLLLQSKFNELATKLGERDATCPRRIGKQRRSCHPWDCVGLEYPRLS